MATPTKSYLFRVSSFMYYGRVTKHKGFIEVDDCIPLGEEEKVNLDVEQIEEKAKERIPKMYFNSTFVTEIMNRTSLTDVLEKILA